MPGSPFDARFDGSILDPTPCLTPYLPRKQQVICCLAAATECPVPCSRLHSPILRCNGASPPRPKVPFCHPHRRRAAKTQPLEFGTWVWIACSMHLGLRVACGFTMGTTERL